MTKLGTAGRVARAFVDSKLTPLFIGAALLLGVGATLLLPREEEPQIVVPMVDVMVAMPGAGAREVEERLTKPMEKLLWEVPGVEYIYSTSSPGQAMAIVRFKVGEDEERAIVRLNQKLFANFDLIPPGASQPLIKPRSIDDVPILALTFWSDRDDYDHYMLRRLVAQVHDRIKEVPDVSEVNIIGGQRRQVRVTLDPARLASRGLAPSVVAPALAAASRAELAGSFSSENREHLVEVGEFLKTKEEVESVVVGVHDGRPVYLRDVAASIDDGAEEPADYVFFATGPAARFSHSLGSGAHGQAAGPAAAGPSVPSGDRPAVTVSVAKRKGTNAIDVADAVLEKVRGLQGSANLIPGDVQVTVTRNYGETALEKSNELLFHMLLAVISVSLLVALALGLRGAGVVALAIPVTLALTLAVFYLQGYTLNRVTLFALVFSIGILVDDAIVVVENIVRHNRLPANRGRPLMEVAAEAVDEVGNPTILATFAVIAAIVPMAFVRGLMGPYMRPIPVGASAAMIFSLLVAFVVTPWAAIRLMKPKGGKGGGGPVPRTLRRRLAGWLLTSLFRLLKRPAPVSSIPVGGGTRDEEARSVSSSGSGLLPSDASGKDAVEIHAPRPAAAGHEFVPPPTGIEETSHGEESGWTVRLYHRMMDPLIARPLWRWAFFGLVAVLFAGAVGLVYAGGVRVKMLPFDNKSEFQVIVDMPEGSTLEETARVVREIGREIQKVPEVADLESYVGTASPYNFNGLVRHYFLRRGPNVADVQVNLAPKGERSAQSHDIAKRVRGPVQAVAEKYGARVKVAEIPPGPPVLQTLVAEVYGPDYAGQIELARKVRGIFESTPGVVDVDWYVEDDQPKDRFIVDREKAALSGVSVDQVVEALKLAVEGVSPGLLHRPEEKEDVVILLQLPRAERSNVAALLNIKVAGPGGALVPLSEIVRVERTVEDKSIYHKNLMPVVYVTGDVAGLAESPVYVIGAMQKKVAELELPGGYRVEQLSTRQPFSVERPALKWDGEWHISYEVFRDLGLAFAAVLVLIYILVVGWFQSMRTPLVIMTVIPFSLIGILPAHWAMGAFFTATSMIGFIAGAGIVVRNSIILVDFIELRLAQGMPLAQAVVDAGAVRFRPMMLTAAAVVVGASVILFDPIFQGLAISLMAGEVASLLLARMAVPVLYYMMRRRELARAKVPASVEPSGR